MISSFKMALRSIGSNKMRAALTMLGIIIGVMALVVLVSLVNGATNTVTDEVSSLGSNYVDAYVWRQEVGSSLTINDLRKWAQENEYVEAVAPVNTGDAKGKAGSSSDSISLYGTMPAYADINGLTIEYGRFLKNTDVDNSSRVCVLSKQAAEQIVGYADCVGEDFSIDGMRYTIVGVLGERTSLVYGGSRVPRVYIPFTSFTRQYPQNGSAISEFYVTAPEGTKMADAEAAVKEFLYDFFGNGDSFYVYSMSVMEDTMGSVTNILKILLGGIASISLIVGGIGIMNIMLVTVTGAHARDRHPQGHRRGPRHHTAAISDGSGRSLHARVRHRNFSFVVHPAACLDHRGGRRYAVCAQRQRCCARGDLLLCHRHDLRAVSGKQGREDEAHRRTALRRLTWKQNGKEQKISSSPRCSWPSPF